MIDLTPTQRRDFRARAHHLNPVVTIAAKGLSPSVIAEIKRSLQVHELIKIRLQGMERDQRAEMMTSICEQVDAAPVQHIGNILVIWRPRDEETPSATARPAEKTKPSAQTKSAKAFASNARKTLQRSAGRFSAARPGTRGKRSPGPR